LKKFLKKIEKPEKPILIVSHQAAIRTLIGNLMKMEKNEMLTIDVPQGTIYFIDTKKSKIAYTNNGLMKKGFLKRTNL